MDDGTALTVAGLTKRYDGRVVVDDVSFRVATGTLTTVLGPNGAGKTTTIECCEGLRAPDAGTITLLGRDRFTHQKELRTRVGVMLQDGGLPMAPRAGSVLSHVAQLHRNPRNPDELLDVLGLAEHARTRVRHLSGGQRQRLALACALVGQPELVFLDEPSAGLDPASRRAMHEMLRSLVADGTTIILTTHLMEEAQILSDEVIVMSRGSVVTSGASLALLGAPAIWISGADLDQIQRLLEPHLAGRSIVRQPAVIEVTGQDGGEATVADLSWVANQLEGHEIADIQVSLRPRTLEDLYFDVVGP